jgi:hypothetical protein
MKGSFLGWLVGLVMPGQEIFFVPWLFFVGPVQNTFFLAVHCFNSFVPSAQQAGQTGRTNSNQRTKLVNRHFVPRICPCLQWLGGEYTSATIVVLLINEKLKENARSLSMSYCVLADFHLSSYSKGANEGLSFRE